MNPAGWCIKNNRISIVALLMIVVAGIGTYRTMPRLEDPEFTIREAVVVTVFPGASPERVESLVTDKLETRVRELAEVERVQSQSRSNVSILNVRIKDDYSDLQPIWQKLRNKVADARRELPEGVSAPVVHDDFGDVFGILLALTGEDFTDRELKEAAEDLRDHFRRIPEVARIELHGIQEERIYIEISNARLANLGISPHALARILQTQNAITPGGDAVVDGERIIIEPTGEFTSLEDLRQTSIRLPGVNEAVLLEDIAEVRRASEDPPTMQSRYQGRTSVVLALSMVSGENIMHLGEAVRSEAEKIRQTLPVGMDLEELYFQPDYVERSLDEFMMNLGMAIVFVFVTMLVFTGLRTGVIAGAILPVAVLLSVAMMPWFDVELEKVSIASLIIALGLLVSNGIVVSENILVRLTDGEDRLDAARGAVKELAFPMLASQLTTIFAFMPIATAQSEVGEYCRSLFVVVAIALLGSWALALTFTPFLSYFFQRPEKKKADGGGRGLRLYRRILLAGLRHRYAVAGGVGLATVLAIWAFGFIPTVFFPPLEREMFLVELQLPHGSDISVTRERVLEVESLLREQSEVVSVGAMIGSGGPRWYLALAPEQANPAYAMLMVQTETPQQVEGLLPRLRERIEEMQPEVRAQVRRLEMGPPVGSPIQVRIFGDDLETLYDAADQVKVLLAETRGIYNLHDDWGEWTKKMVVDVNQQQAKRAGLSSQDISLSLLTQMSGLPVTEFREGGELIPVIMRSSGASRENLAGLENLHVYSFLTGQSVPLEQVAQTRLTWQPSNIRRRNATRTLTLKADVAGRFSSDALEEIRPQLETLTASRDWPAGYGYEIGGESEESDRAQQSILEGVGPAAGLLFMVLLVQFNSVRATIVILLSIFPMMIGITPGMLLTRTPFGFMAMLGLISLAGIIVNNAILLLDRVRTEEGEGLAPAEALVTASVKRLRPILLMAFTAMIGLLPLAVLGGALWTPMANVMIFGLLTASVLGLVLTPVLHAVFHRITFTADFFNDFPNIQQRDAGRKHISHSN
ncbi:MAG: efflux RND transporter permease subunit [Verrucomicrobia bacterium]|nr:efflux RND transporter permease subunit [Verrucomicrobiota bacterium]MCH8511025.1 efflux RND transporter permease subunit [Kiritimatiellia bacterium]